MNKNPFFPILLLILGLSLSACATMQEAGDMPSTVEGAAPEVKYNEDVDAIIAQHLEARGGVDMLSGINSMKWEGSLMLQGTEMGATMFFKGPDLVKTTVLIEGMGGAEIAYNGEVYWVLNPGSDEAQEIPGALATSFFPFAEVYSELADYSENGHTVTFEALEELESGPAFKLNMALGEESNMALFIDAESFMLVREEYNGMNPQTGEPAAIVNNLSDYRDVGGVMMPFGVERTLDGQAAFAGSLETIEINVEVDDDVFQMPFPKPSIK